MSPFTSWLKSMSTVTIWVDPINVGARLHSTFAPETTPEGMSYDALASNQALYDARYGVGAHSQKGNVVGERYSEVFVIDAIQAGLAGVPTDYVPTQLDGFDVCMLQYGVGSIFDTFFVTEYHKRHPETAPPPVDPPPVTPPTVPPVAPPKPDLKIPQDILDTAAVIASWIPANLKAKRTRAMKLAAAVASIATYKAK
jgi:hypothetical protein